METKLPLGKVVEKVRSTSVGQAATEIPPEVLPLPLSVTTAEKNRLLTLLMCGTFYSDVSQGFQKTIHTASINYLCGCVALLAHRVDQPPAPSPMRHTSPLVPQARGEL